jgi:hypothetical protein
MDPGTVFFRLKPSALHQPGHAFIDVLAGYVGKHPVNDVDFQYVAPTPPDEFRANSIENVFGKIPYFHHRAFFAGAVR